MPFSEPSAAPRALPAELRPLLADLHVALEAVYGDRLVRLVLYGSFARGQAHAESDVDVLVVLDGEVQPGAEIRRMSEARFEVSLKHKRYVSAMPVSETDYRQQESMWLQNVQREGVML